jgi:hypothetical protein
MVEGRVGPGLPASLLMQHENLTVITDQDAVSQIDPDVLAHYA